MNDKHYAQRIGLKNDYARRLGLAIEHGIIASDQSDVFATDVNHESSCSIWGKQPCDCLPDIWITTKKGKVFGIDKDGYAFEKRMEIGK